MLVSGGCICDRIYENGLIADRQVWRKVGFHYLKCCSLPIAEATNTNFSHNIQHFLTCTFKTVL